MAAVVCGTEIDAKLVPCGSCHGMDGRGRQHLAAQYVAPAEAKILAEDLKHAGCDLVRERLVESLEGLYNFSTGFGPSVNFGPAKHIGITRFHIMTIDPVSGSLAEVNRARE